MRQLQPGYGNCRSFLRGTLSRVGLLVLACLPASLFAQSGFDARRAGMAFSNAASTVGLEQVGLNPALLAMPYPFRLEVNLFAGHLTAANNAFQKSQYDRLFTTGDSLTAAEKDEILQSIPEGGLRALAAVRANLLAVYTRNFSLSVFVQGHGTAKLPRDLIELPLLGNAEEGRIYRIGDVEGVGWAAVGIAFGVGIPLEGHEGPLGMQAIGVSARYYAGLEYGEIVEAELNLHNFSADRPSLDLDGHYRARVARGGRGLGLDIGVLLQPHPDVRLGVAVLNMVGGIRWSESTETHQGILQAQGLSLPNRLSDSLLVRQDTTFAIDAFTTRLPVTLDVSAGWQVHRRLLFTAEWEQGLNRAMGNNLSPRLAVGLEWLPVPSIPLRTGISADGREGISLALGTGIDLKYWKLDVAYLSHRGLFPNSSKGMTLAVTTRFKF